MATNNNNKNNGIKANKAQQIKLVDIDVKQAKKDIDEIAKYADKKFNDLKNKIGNIGFTGGVSPISFTQSRNTGGSSLAQSANRPAYTNGTTNLSSYFNSSSGLNFEKIASTLNNSRRSNYEAKGLADINSITKFSNEKVYKSTMKNLKPLVESGKLTQEAARKQAQNAVKQEKINSLLTQSADKFSKSGDLLQVGAKAFSSLMSTGLQLFKSGMSKQSSVYESTYTNVAVRTQLDQSGYRRRQANINNELSNRGLRDSIASSDVMQSWSDLSDRGLSLKDIDNYSMDDVITKKIVPYLDTMSNSFLNIQNNLGLDFTRNIRGITKSVQDTAGSTRFTVENLNEMITQLEPMSISAKEDLVSKNAAGASAYIDSLLKSGEITSQEAQSMKQNTYDLMYNQSGIMENGSPAQILALSKMWAAGIDPSKDMVSALEYYTNTSSEMFGDILGNNDNGAMSGYIGEIVGKNIIGNQNYVYGTDNGISAEGRSNAHKAAKEAQRLIEQNASDVTTALADRKYDTNARRQEITMENLSNEFSTLEGLIGHWGTPIKDTLSAILSAITLGQLGKAASFISGTTSAGGLPALLGNAGPIAGLLAGAYGAYEIGKSIYESYRIEKEIQDRIGDIRAAVESKYKGTEYENTGVVDADTVNTTLNEKQAKYEQDSEAHPIKSFLGIDAAGMSNAGTGIVHGLNNIGNTVLDLFTGGNWDGGYSLNLTGMKWMMSEGNAFRDEKDWLTWAYMLDAHGLSGVLNDLGVGITDMSHEKLKTAWKSGFMTEEEIEQRAREIEEAGWKVYDASGKLVSGFDFKPESYNRLGLDCVPYDNYPALLHEGETVLEQNTANQLRHMISKYEDSEQQSVRFREAIQEQTRELLSRLDAILNIISTENTSRMIANEMARIQSPTDGNILNMVPIYNR